MTVRNGLMLLMALSLALTTSCVDAVDTPNAQPPAAAQNEVSLGAPSEPEQVHIDGLSPRTTPDHTWAEPDLTGLVARIPLAVATLGDHFHFEVPGASVSMVFIGYQLDGQFHIRAVHCPACGGKNLDYDAGVLVCSDCNATFDAATGTGITVAWGYPSGSIPVSVSEEQLSSPIHSLTVAYERTVSGEETLYQGPVTPQGGGGGGGCGC